MAPRFSRGRALRLVSGCLLALLASACASTPSADPWPERGRTTRAVVSAVGPAVLVRSVTEPLTGPEPEPEESQVVVPVDPPPPVASPFELADLPYDSSLEPVTLPAAAVGVGGNWRLYFSTGADRLEEDVEATEIGLADTFLTMQWHYGVGEGAELVWGLSGVRTQDEGLLEAFDDADFAWGIVGVRVGF